MDKIRREILELSNKEFHSFKNTAELLSEKFTKDSTIFQNISNTLNSELIDSNTSVVQITSILQRTIKSMKHAEIALDFFQELNSIFELKIINLYRNIEITVKRMVEKAYPEITMNGLFRHDSLKNLFTSKKVDITRIEGYLEFNELRLVNNNLKHGFDINKEVRKIKEFDSELFEFESLNLFYDRIEPRVHLFLKNIGGEIVEELFVFTPERIKEITKEFRNRMKVDDLKKLADSLMEI
jgi:hypothetical protein